MFTSKPWETITSHLGCRNYSWRLKYSVRLYSNCLVSIIFMRRWISKSFWSWVSNHHNLQLFYLSPFFFWFYLIWVSWVMHILWVFCRCSSNIGINCTPLLWLPLMYTALQILLEFNFKWTCGLFYMFYNSWLVGYSWILTTSLSTIDGEIEMMRSCGG